MASQLIYVEMYHDAENAPTYRGGVLFIPYEYQLRGGACKITPLSNAMTFRKCNINFECIQ